jgi:phage tail-like protein
MALPDLDSSVGHSFGLEFDGVVIKQIAEVSGLKIGQDVVEFKQDTDSGKFIVKKLPGRPKAGEVTLTRGLTHDSSFEDWIRAHSSARYRTPAKAARSSSSTTKALRSSATSSSTRASRPSDAGPARPATRTSSPRS